MSELAQPHHVLFVCTGNTCRSPLAEALARREADSRGWIRFRVSSAGTSAFEGAPASDGSLEAARIEGVDLSAHRARRLSREMVAEADVILAMSASHMARVVALGGEDKVDLLTRFVGGGSSGVPDPFGGDANVYRRTYRVLEALVVRALDRLEVVVDP